MTLDDSNEAKKPKKTPLSWTLAVDLGAGTGLVGEQLRKHCQGEFFACDLSHRMLAVAKSKRVYDRIVVNDAVRFLNKEVALGMADLIVAADVLIYIHDLQPLFDAVERALQPQGLFAFTTESCTLEEAGGVPPAGPGWMELPSKRVAHAAEYTP